MKITKERLLTLTQMYLNKLVRSDHSVVCVYLVGSMLEEDPFINGTTDVDLVIVHNVPVSENREIVAISPEATLDIHHIEQNTYSPPRKIRKDPWVGSSLCFDPIVLYGTGHWFEFAQASVEAGFFQPEAVIYRSRLFSNAAREKFSSLGTTMQQGGNYTAAYLKTIENAANAVATLVGKPLTDRTMFKQFKAIADNLDEPELMADLHALLLGNRDISPYYEYFFNAWKYYIEFFGNNPVSHSMMKLNASRLLYYMRPVEWYWNEHLTSSIWLMAKTWSSIANYIQLDDNEYYNSFLTMLEISPHFFVQRHDQLEALLEKVEDVQEKWGREKGFIEP